MKSTEINQIREDLVQHLQNITTLTKDALIQFKESQGNQPDIVDKASIQSEMDYTFNKLLRKGTNESNILKALEKIENGNYGICEQCEEVIPIKRLKAIPDAKNCIACQKDLEELLMV